MLWVGLPAADLTTTPAWGADQSGVQTTITLEVINEPLGSVLAKIARNTSWKIKAPEKWLDRPVTQSLNKATLEEGLRTVLNSAGVANLLITYDEYFKAAVVFDTEAAQSQAANHPPSPTSYQPPVMSVTGIPDPILQRAAERAAGLAPARASSRARRRSSDDD